MKKQLLYRFLLVFMIISLFLPGSLLNFLPKAKAAEEVLTVAEAIEKFKSTGNDPQVTVEGYIIGHTTGPGSYDYDAPFGNDFNFILADSPLERAESNYLPVQVPESYRANFGLNTNPSLVGKKVKVTASLELYFSQSGLKNPISIEMTGETEEQPILNMTIADARQKIGQAVKIEGIVTADNAALGGNKLSTFIQDETGGINLYSNSPEEFPELTEGKRISVTGTITTYRGLTEIVPETAGINVLSDLGQLPTAVEMSLIDLNNPTVAEAKEGQLIKVKAFVQDLPATTAGGGFNVSVIDEHFNRTTIRIMETTQAIEAVEEKKWYEFTGILSQYNQDYQVLPRKQSDINLLKEQPKAPQSAGEYPSRVKSIVDGDTIHLETPVLGSTKVRYVNIDTPETYHSVVNELDQNQLDHGNRAKSYLNELLKPGDEVIVKLGEKATDDYGRLLAQVIRKEDNVNTNLEMVKKGLAVTYFIWPLGSETDYHTYQAAVKEAKDNGLGIWNPQEPLLELPFAFRAREEGKGFTRYVGNSATKLYVSPEDWEEVPVENRIFFASALEAESNGFYPKSTKEESKHIRIQLLGVNDLHGKVDITVTSGGIQYGRMDYLAAYLRQREAENQNTLIVHAGDMVGGSSPVSALLQDEPTVEMMELIGFDVGTVGNHEFDEGVQEMLRLIHGGEHPNGTQNYNGIDFPMVAANVEYKATGQQVLDPYVVKEIAGEKIGFIGVATVDTPSMIISKGNEHIRFTDEAEAINKYVPELQAQGVEAIVILAHVPGDQTGGMASGAIADLANSVNDAVDVIFAAHNHVKMNAVVDNKLIVQAWEYGKAFSDVDVEIDRITGDIVKKSAEIVDVKQGEITPDGEIGAILGKYLEMVGPKLNEVIGSAAVSMAGGYAQNGYLGDNPLGNLIADGMAAAMNSDFALMNGGGIRDDLDAGDITWNELFNIQPFGNTLVKLDVSGQDLREILNAQFSSYGPDLSISGFTYTWDRINGDGEVVDIYLPNGKEINPSEIYTITVNNYMYPHSFDKYRLAELGENPVQGPEDLLATVEFIKAHDGPIAYESEGRISEDFYAPESTLTVSEPDNEDGTYSEEARITLSAVDKEVGVKFIEYKLNEGEWTVYQEPILITDEGEHTLSYRAVDKVYNVEEVKTLKIVIKYKVINDVKNLIQQTSINHGLKTSLGNHLDKAQKELTAAEAYPEKEEKHLKRAINLLNEVKKKVEHIPDHQLSEQDKIDLTSLIDQVIETINRSNSAL